MVKIARICRRNLPAHDTRLSNNNSLKDHRDISIKCGVGKLSRVKQGSSRRGYANGRSTFPVVKYGVKVIRDGIGSSLLCLWLVTLLLCTLAKAPRFVIMPSSKTRTVTWFVPTQ